MSNLHFTATIDAAKLNKTLEDIEKRIKGLSDKGKDDSGFLQDSIVKLGRAIDEAFTLGNLKELVNNIVKVRGEVQQLENSFAGLIKSKNDATVLMHEMMDLVAKSPFELSEIADGARQLLGYGSASRTVVSEIKMLGEVATGVAMPINDLIELYGSLKNSGQASASDLESFAAKGIPIYNELGKVLNAGVGRVKELAEAGRVSAKDIQQAFTNMTSSGGMFQGMIAKQSQTLTGLTDSFNKALSNMFNEMGQSQEGVLTTGIEGATYLVEHYKSIAKILTIIIEIYGAYKAIIITTNAIEKGVEAGKTGWAALTTVIYAASGAQSVFNTIAKANPYILVASLLAILATTFLLFRDNVDAAAEAQKTFNEELQKAKQQKDELIGKTQSLTNVINNETSSRFEQIEAFRELQKLYPELYNSMTLDTFKKKEAAAVQRDLNKAMDEMSIRNAEKKLKETADAVASLEAKMKKFNSLQTGFGAAPAFTIADGQELDKARSLLEQQKNRLRELKEIAEEANTPAKEQVEHYEKVKANLEKNIQNIRGTVSPLKQAGKEANVMKQIFDQIRLTGLLKDLDETNAKLDKAKDKLRNEKDTRFANGLVDVKTAKDLRGLIKEASTNDRKDSLVQKTKAMLDSTEKTDPEYAALAKLYGELTAEKKDVAPFGSLKYWEEVLKKAKDALSLVTKPESGDTKKLMKKRLDAEFKVAELRLKLDKNYADGSIESYEKIAQSAKDLMSKVNPFDPRYGEAMKTEKENREKAENLRKALAVRSVDEEIEEKKKQYELYNLWVKHVGKEAADEQFKNLKDSGAGFKEYLETNINTIQSRVNDKTATGLDLENLVKYKTAFESINQNIDEYKQKITSAGQAVGSLTEYLKLLKEEQAKLGTNDDGKNAFLAAQIAETENKRRELLKSFFIENNLGEEKRLAIQKKYDDLRASLDKEYADKKSTIYQKALNKINLQEQNELNEADGYFKDIVEKTQKELAAIVEKKSRNKLKQFINDSYTNLTEMQIAGKTGTEVYKQMEKAIDDAKKKLKELDNASLKEMISVVGQIGSELKGVGGKLGEMGTLLSNISTKASGLPDLLSGSLSVENAVGQALQQIVDLVVTIANNRKQSKEAEKQYYNTVISQQNEYNKLLNDELRLKSQIHGNQYVKDFKGIVLDSINAQADALNRYKESVLKLKEEGKAKDGLTSYSDSNDLLKGAMAGGVIGVVATAIFGKKKKDNLTPVLEKYPLLYDATKEGVDGFNKSLAQSLINSKALDEESEKMLQGTLDWVEKYEEAQKQVQDVIVELTGQIGNDLRNALVSAFENGTDAAKAFGDTVSKVLENIISQTLFSAVFGQAFDALKADFENSLSEKGDGVLTDDLVRFYEKYPDLVNVFTKGLEEAKKEAEKAGLTIFEGQDDRASGSNGLSGSIKSITEETAGLLAGQINAIRINQATNTDIMKNQLLNLTEIAANTRYLKYLESIDNRIGKINSTIDLRSIGT